MYCTAWLLKAGVHTVGAPFSFEKIQGDLPGSGVYVVDLELQDPPIDGPPLLWAILWTLATKAEWESFIHGVIPWP